MQTDKIQIRKAGVGDVNRLGELLESVCRVHAEGRPDLFRNGGRKYTDEELIRLVDDASRPIFVSTGEDGGVTGYVFCQLEHHDGQGALTNHKTLYIDDLCVDEQYRGKGIGRALYDYVLHYSKKNNCHHVTLNVWACNPSAVHFYEKCGMQVYKMGMEKIISYDD